MDEARNELIEKVNELLAAWKSGEEFVDGNFSEALTPGMSTQAYSSDTLYRATMRLADSFADALSHKASKVDGMDYCLAAEALIKGVDLLVAGNDVPDQLRRYR